MQNYPKISIVTPSYNQGQYIEETILSVIGQNYPNLEYIIIDGGSTDNTVEIIKKYEKHLAYWVSEADKGMYHAIQKGFEQSTGEIMAWINSDDLFVSNSFFTIAKVFIDLPQVQWFQAYKAFTDEKGGLNWVYGVPDFYTKLKFYVYPNACLHQNAVIWRRSLWEKAGSKMKTNFKVAGDYELFFHFFAFADLYPLNTLISAFRVRSKGEQLSRDCGNLWNEERDKTRKEYSLSKKEKLVWFILKNIGKLKIGKLTRLLERKLLKYPQSIQYNLGSKKYVIL